MGVISRIQKETVLYNLSIYKIIKSVKKNMIIEIFKKYLE